MALPGCSRRRQCTPRRVVTIFFYVFLTWLVVTLVIVSDDGPEDSSGRRLGFLQWLFSSGQSTGIQRKRVCADHSFEQVSQPQFVTLHSQIHLLTPAYYDDRKPGEVYFRILALLAGNSKPTSPDMYCHVTLNDSTVISKKLQWYVFNENLNVANGGYILSCPLSSLQIADQCSVSISLSSDAETGKVVRLPALVWHRDDHQGDFAICVPPLFGSVTVENIVEFVEMHKLLGVQHVFFYDFRTPFRTKQAVDLYVRQGVATSYPWSLPMQEGFVRYFGQLLTVHHCMFTAMWRYRYVAFVDLDEYIIPREGLVTWNDVMASIDHDINSGFRFFSAFFPPTVNPVPSNNNLDTKLMTLTWTQKSDGYHLKRTKCIVRPERMFEMGVHHISKWNEEQWPAKSVHRDVALVHHYRTCFQSNFNGSCFSHVTDNSALRYASQLMLAYDSTMALLAEN